MQHSKRSSFAMFKGKSLETEERYNLAFILGGADTDDEKEEEVEENTDDDNAMEGCTHEVLDGVTITRCPGKHPQMG